MAIFYCQTSLIKRSKARSATASAAYRAAEKILDSRTGVVHDYERKKGVLDKFIFNSSLSRSELWNLAESSERRSDSRVAREWILALPHELRRDSHQRIIKAFSQSLIDRYGVAIDVCVHAPGKGSDHRNLHAHLLMTTRPVVDSAEFGKLKTELEWSDAKLRKNGLPTGREQIEKIRQQWANTVNDELQKAGLNERITHLSLKAQGSPKIPQIHVGPLNSQLAKMGYHERASRWQLNEKIKAQNEKNKIIEHTTKRVLMMQNQPIKTKQMESSYGGLASSQHAVNDALENEGIDIKSSPLASQKREIKTWKPVEVDDQKGSVISLFEGDENGVYRWRKGKNEGTEAFRDKGKTIISNSTNGWALAAEIELAKSKLDAGEWKEIRAFGKEEYRRAIWIQAQSMGVEIQGYTPSKDELEKYSMHKPEVQNGLTTDPKETLPNKGGFSRNSQFSSDFVKEEGDDIQATSRAPGKHSSPKMN